MDERFYERICETLTQTLATATTEIANLRREKVLFMEREKEMKGDAWEMQDRITELELRLAKKGKND